MTDSQFPAPPVIARGSAPPLPTVTEVGRLGICHLKRLWSRSMAHRMGQPAGEVSGAEWQRDRLVIDAVGLGLEQVIQYLLGSGATFAEFEDWIVRTAGEVPPERVERINAALRGEPPPASALLRRAEIDRAPPALTTADLAHWQEHGYVILSAAVPEADRADAEQLLWNRLGGSPGDPESWYAPKINGIMVQLFQDPVLTRIRNAPRVHKAFAQLWGTADLWPTTDRMGFNVPERPGHLFSGPDLHWDVSLERPIPFGTQGILYLTETPPEQGAFTLVPGFQHRLEAWLDGLPHDAIPGQQDLHALGSKPIGGQAGDLIIWDHRLPHGSRPNRGTKPRLVHYVNMYATTAGIQDGWP